MNIETVLESIESRVRDKNQRDRIKALAERTQAAFDKTRSSGVKAELELDWQKLKSKFTEVLQNVQKETGLY